MRCEGVTGAEASKDEDETTGDRTGDDISNDEDVVDERTGDESEPKDGDGGVSGRASGGVCGRAGDEGRLVGVPRDRADAPIMAATLWNRKWVQDVRRC